MDLPLMQYLCEFIIHKMSYIWLDLTLNNYVNFIIATGFLLPNSQFWEFGNKKYIKLKLC